VPNDRSKSAAAAVGSVVAAAAAAAAATATASSECNFPSQMTTRIQNQVCQMTQLYANICFV
jgi:hypothetical protein